MRPLLVPMGRGGASGKALAAGAAPRGRRRRRPPAASDALTKTAKKGVIELGEEQLKRSTGGIIVVCDRIKPL